MLWCSGVLASPAEGQQRRHREQQDSSAPPPINQGHAPAPSSAANGSSITFSMAHSLASATLPDR